MTAGQFADLVYAMRKAQKEYFKTRNPLDLRNAKQLESEVDSLLAKRKKTREENCAKENPLFNFCSEVKDVK